MKSAPQLTAHSQVSIECLCVLFFIFFYCLILKAYIFHRGGQNGKTETAVAQEFQTYLEKMASSTVNILPLGQSSDQTNKNSPDQQERDVKGYCSRTSFPKMYTKSLETNNGCKHVCTAEAKQLRFIHGVCVQSERILTYLSFLWSLYNLTVIAPWQQYWSEIFYVTQIHFLNDFKVSCYSCSIPANRHVIDTDHCPNTTCSAK